MSIQKKSLISTLKTAKKANAASAPVTEVGKGEKVESLRMVSTKAALKSLRQVSTKSAIKSLKAQNFRSMRSQNLRKTI